MISERDTHRLKVLRRQPPNYVFSRHGSTITVWETHEHYGYRYGYAPVWTAYIHVQTRKEEKFYRTADPKKYAALISSLTRHSGARTSSRQTAPCLQEDPPRSKQP